MSQLPTPPVLSKIDSDAPIALFLDFDGTLVEIASTPDGIVVPDDLADRLHRLCRQLDGRLALVSGRAIDDLHRHLGHLELVRAGSHGSDCRAADGSTIGQAPGGLKEEVLGQVTSFVAEHGLTQEDKPHGAALHYRVKPSLEDKVLSFASTLAEANDLDVKRGKCVVELVARGANKGAAVRAIMAEPPFLGATPVFVGDDVTDEDGMAAAREFGGFGVAVGDRASENAKYGLASPAAVQQWLEL